MLLHIIAKTRVLYSKEYSGIILSRINNINTIFNHFKSEANNQ